VELLASSDIDGICEVEVIATVPDVPPGSYSLVAIIVTPEGASPVQSEDAPLRFTVTG
jgi:hypothetical protein